MSLFLAIVLKQFITVLQFTIHNVGANWGLIGMLHKVFISITVPVVVSSLTAEVILRCKEC